MSRPRRHRGVFVGGRPVVPASLPSWLAPAVRVLGVWLSLLALVASMGCEGVLNRTEFEAYKVENDAKVSGLQSQLAGLEGKFTKFKETTNSRHSEIETSLQKEKSTREAKWSDLDRRLVELSSALGASKDELDKLIDANKQTIGNLTQAQTQQRDNLATLSQAHQNDFEALERKRGALEQKLDHEVATLRAEFDELRRTITDYYDGVSGSLIAEYRLIKDLTETYPVFADSFAEAAEKMSRDAKTMVERADEIMSKLNEMTQQLVIDLATPGATTRPAR